ncbi:stage V sporulation protein AD [Fodinisporobacter ferrooxydans]|uniref:Stage V sporulation protein AD n=1 Tax=Fodinisporobacter ferrooxydans TaxID=2901836 RepID=A0ABY4CKW3_9BACL|nr:stage V sporulation protein AD [Alicyclobacillaceae bacterium MYW30-H2]
MSKLGSQTWEFKNRPCIVGTGTAVGPKEGQGPLGNLFDIVHDDLYVGQDSWEKAERYMLEEAVNKAVKKSGIEKNQLDYIFAGDLINQITPSSFAARSLSIPYIGIFGACSTSMLGLSLAALLVDSGYGEYVAAATGSHVSTAERQFRYPTEYGGQKPPTAHCTVTGGGAAIVGKAGNGPVITHATIGKVIDMGVKSPWEMGAAMAPAAADTIAAHFKDADRKPSDYDLIVTGDLARVGHPIAQKLLAEAGYDCGDRFTDCGILIYDPKQPEVFSGGSGCACCAVVSYSYIFQQMLQGKWKRVLITATGALLSPLTNMQGETIPCIAHSVSLEMGGNSQ